MRRGLRIILAAIAILALVFVVPPLVSVSHFKTQITQLISQSLGRPVRLSSVQAHILPWPGFEISDLSVAEDPAYGAEPVLHANNVTASIRLLALFTGHLEIGKISVDEASLNLVRAGPGRWNLDSIFRTAAAQTTSAPGARHVAPLPYLEATDSRINFKNGAEKLPFSLVNADLSLWQENSGEWRIRLRGQPARTDVSLYLEETGVVRVEASMRRAAALSQMPLHLDIDWREAQLGQLARLITGSDPGWRGDLTGELHLDGTADAAQISTRLRATGVHRAEFTPASPLDFDARCGLVYHYAERSVENLTCDSPLGDGHVRIAGEKRGELAPPRFSVELDRVPIAAGLDALRTLRSGLAPDLEAKGTVSGKIVYDVRSQGNPDQVTPGQAVPAPAMKPAMKPPMKTDRKPPAKSAPEKTGPLTGSLTVADLILTGAGLGRPIQAPKFTLEPTLVGSASQALAEGGQAGDENPGQAMVGSVAIPAGGPVPLTFDLRFSRSGYQVAAHGQAGFARAREFVEASGIPVSQALEALAGEPITVDLTSQGPWIPADVIQLNNLGSAEVAPASETESPASTPPVGAAPEPSDRDTLTGTVIVRNANWNSGFLASRIVVEAATLHIENGVLRWDPVDFTYGPLKGSGNLTLPADCASQQTLHQSSLNQPCPAQFQLRFGDLDAAIFESALLGAREKGTVLSNLINRLRPTSAPPWPPLEGTVSADSLVLGPVTLEGVSASLKIVPTGAEISSLDAGLFGGTVHIAGTLGKPANGLDKPDYTLGGDFQKFDAGDLSKLLGLRWACGALSGSGNVELAGYTENDLAASAKGTLHFECRQGSVSNTKTPSADVSKPASIPAALAHFDRWTADASIADQAINIGANQIISGARESSVDASITFGDPPQVSFPAPKDTRAEKHK